MIKYKRLAAKLISAIFLLILTIAFTATLYATGDLFVNLNGQPLELTQPPTNIGGRVMVPFRDIFEALDAEVFWDHEFQTISAVGSSGSKQIVLTIGSETAMLNGNPVLLDAAPVIVSGRTLVPIRFVSESLGAYVRWDGDTGTVYITSKSYSPWPQAIFESDPSFFEANIQFRNENQSSRLIPSNGLLARAIEDFYRVNLRYIKRQYAGLQTNGTYNIDSSISDGLREAIISGLREESFMMNFPVNVEYFEEVLKNIDFYVVTDPNDVLGLAGYTYMHHGNRVVTVIIRNESWEEGAGLAMVTYVTIHELLHAFGFGEPSTGAITHLLMRLDQSARRHEILVYNPGFDLTLVRRLDREGRSAEYFNSLWSNDSAVALWNREMPDVPAAKLNRARSIGETFVMYNREMAQIFESATGYCLFDAGHQMGEDWRIMNGEISGATQAKIDAARRSFNYMLDVKNRFAGGRRDLWDFYLVLEWFIEANHGSIKSA